ncbi:hypothetical protein [Burkholderia arboris]|uniref:hypothetical protein n=1 Tax=Burkholderia arboris TaxID=488730 RepID=UPI00210AA291|nr:hypothetical protein [Burkholderia arboris]UTV53237.1 hypothetical protein NLX30_10065 [Burkholderia arboris]
MIRNPQQIKLMALGLPAVPANGGGSSDSQAATTTTNADQRNNVGSGVGATASSGGSVTLNVQQLDGGAIAGAFGLGHDALAGLEQFGTSSMSAVSHSAEMAVNGVLSDAAGTRQAYADAASAAISAAQQASGQVASAYQDAKTGNQRTLMIGALVVVGLAVTMPFLMREAA